MEFKYLTVETVTGPLLSHCRQYLPALLNRVKAPGLIVLDIEATGFIGPEFGITEFGAVIYTSDACIRVRSFVNPENRISKQASEVTGITQAMVKTAPTWPQVFTELFTQCNGFAVGGFNLKTFDLKAFQHQAERYGLPDFEYPFVFEVMDAVRKSLNAKSNLKLGLAMELFDVQANAQLHRADIDAECTLKVMLQVLKEFGLNAFAPKVFALPEAKQKKPDPVKNHTPAIQRDILITRTLLEGVQAGYRFPQLLRNTETLTGFSPFDVSATLCKLLTAGTIQPEQVCELSRLVSISLCMKDLTDKSKLKTIRDTLVIKGVLADYVEIQAALCAEKGEQ